jgi:hypothetical protein
MLVKHIVIVLTIAVTGCAAPHSPEARFGDFPITAKGCGATVLSITGEDTENALATRPTFSPSRPPQASPGPGEKLR